MSATIKSATDPDAIAEACTTLQSGALVAIPTETVYGLAADATSGEAIARIYEAKARPRFNPLIAHVSNKAMAEQLVAFNPAAEKLAEAFWPGPLTLVLPRLPHCPVHDLASAGLDTLAVRCPDHPVPRAVIAAFGKPLVAPSANPSGAVSPTTAQHVAEGLGEKADLILDAGPCAIGLESTVIGFNGENAVLLRKGGLARSDIETITEPLAAPETDAALLSPGMLSSHYAPGAPIRLNAAKKQEGEVLLGFGGRADADLDLSPSASLKEAAANLFAFLRQLDARAPKRIAVSPIPDEGLGEAINDRLQRAAAPRDQT
ncbi:L-threonylcarbamoyladenylate synthase [Hyphobacterium sp.]|uniref:L-threonylcarbamoyladenylate synthase n=1 Tax=Hyphobacterium sp. TaxID=2004662 RepID=UPI003BA93023